MTATDEPEGTLAEDLRQEVLDEPCVPFVT